MENTKTVIASDKVDLGTLMRAREALRAAIKSLAGAVASSDPTAMERAMARLDEARSRLDELTRRYLVLAPRAG